VASTGGELLAEHYDHVTRFAGPAGACRGRAGSIRRAPSPLDGAEHGTNDMTDFLLLVLVNIMGEMRRVPDHHVLV
jgi:hypothetical protein